MNNSIALYGFSTAVESMIHQGVQLSGERSATLLGGSCSCPCGLSQFLWVSSRPQVGRGVDLAKLRALMLQDPHYSAPFHGPISNFVVIILCSFFLKLLPPYKLYKIQVPLTLLGSCLQKALRWIRTAHEAPRLLYTELEIHICPVSSPHLSQSHCLSPEVL